MRRPLKPFVTEYKGTRRQGAALQPPSLQSSSQPSSESTQRSGDHRAFDTERSRPKPVDLASRDDGDDSYEAAMRAADALFARPAPPPMQRQVESAAPDEGSDADVSSTGVSSAGASSAAAASERGGRILRVLDEPPPPQLVALEAAHAPKRRGRKPGSKNKPKIKPAEIEPAQVANDAPTDVPARPGLFPSGLSEDPAPLAARTVPADTTSAMQKLEAIPVADALSNGSPSTGAKRFPWIRDRLKPGEGWKRRRLPRICW